MRNVMELKDNWMFVKEAENAADWVINSLADLPEEIKKHQK